MIRYGMRKRGSAKIHPHNECRICSENHVSKSNERFRTKQEIIESIPFNIMERFKELDAMVMDGRRKMWVV